MSSRVRLCCTAAAIALVSLGLPDFMPLPKWTLALAQDEGGGQDSADSGDSGGADSGGSESGGAQSGGSGSGGDDSGGSDSGSDAGSDSGASGSGGSDVGGSDDGGRSDGASDSGASDGGSSSDSGSDGGSSDSGSSDGGASDSESGSDTGGSDTGGTDTGGSDAGGSDSGGADAGGSDTSGSDTGGTDTGGRDTGGSDAGGTDAGGSDSDGGSDTAGGGAGGEATDGTDAAAGGDGVADGGGSEGGGSGAGTPDGGVTYSGGDGTPSGAPSTTPEPPAIIDAIVDLFRPSPEPEPAPADPGSDGTIPPVAETPVATVTDGGTGTVSESGRELIERIAEAVRAGAETIAPAPVVKAPAPVAVLPEVPAPVVEAVPEVRRIVEPEPVQAATAPRIAYSSGGRGGEPEYRQDMVVAMGMDARTRQLVGALGFRIVAERRSALLGNAMVVKLRTPRDMPASAALARLREVAPEVTFDYATLYRPAGAPVPVRYAAELIGAPAPRTCRIDASIGLIDTGVGRHETLGSANIVQRNFVTGKASMNVAHGTAIASILVGDLPGVGPLAPGAALYSANVFAAEGKSIRADAMAIIEALDWMASQRVKVVNLSLMGPQNALLEKAVLAAAQRGQILIAAAGNDGADGPPAYPAAYPGVIAVAAVDARGRPYARNNRGPYVEISAPGVDVWGADARGGEAFWTGTSFAAPYVTAAVARDVAQGRVANINDSRARLRASARDMGAPGRDPIFGSGLLQFGGCSGSGATTLSAKGG